MKQITLTLFAIVLLSFQQPKQYKLNESTIATVQQNIYQVHQYISASNLPQQEAKQIMQLLEQANSAISKDLQDSTINKR